MYYIRVNGQVYGPYTIDQMRSFIAEGRVNAQSEVSTDGNSWNVATAFPGLFSNMGGNPYSTPSTYNSPGPAGYNNPDKSFFQYYLDVWRKYAVSAGRARRKEYWAFGLINFVIFFVFAMVIGVCGGMEEGQEPTEMAVIVAGGGVICMFVCIIALICPNICLTIRRLHDIDWPGWLCLLMFIPYINGLFSLIIGIIGGTPGPNRYGPDPKGR